MEQFEILLQQVDTSDANRFIDTMTEQRKASVYFRDGTDSAFNSINAVPIQ